jgi:hypothetical protein
MTLLRPGWHDSASCQTSDPEIFFPRKGESDLKANLGRKAIGVEIEERYCDAAARRLSQMTLEAS